MSTSATAKKGMKYPIQLQPRDNFGARIRKLTAQFDLVEYQLQDC